MPLPSISKCLVILALALQLTSCRSKSAEDTSAANVVTPSPPTESSTQTTPDPSDATDAISSAKAETAKKVDVHAADREIRPWIDPCQRNVADDKDTATKDDARQPFIDLCNARMPLPSDFGHPLKRKAHGIGYMDFSGGKWECVDEKKDFFDDGYNCGDVQIRDILRVDVDRDGQQEIAAAFMLMWTGNCEEYRLMLYETVDGRPRLKADFRPVSKDYGCVNNTFNRLEPFGKHCIKVVARCEKNCNACDGRGCYEVFVWTGNELKKAQSWIKGDPDIDGPDEFWTDDKLLKLCEAE